MSPVKFTHSNLKTAVYVFPELVAAVYFLATNQTTAILSNAGALIPVEGTVEEVTKAIEAAKTPAKGRKEKK
jgi:hypothetical protein